MFILMPQTGGMSVWITKTTGGKKMKKFIALLSLSLLLASPLPNRTCSIIHHRNKYLTPSAQAFIEVCQEYSNLSTESFQTEEER